MFTPFEGICGRSRTAANSLLKNAIRAFFNLAKLGAELLTARKRATYVAVGASHPCDALLQRSVS